MRGSALIPAWIDRRELRRPARIGHSMPAQEFLPLRAAGLFVGVGARRVALPDVNLYVLELRAIPTTSWKLSVRFNGNPGFAEPFAGSTRMSDRFSISSIQYGPSVCEAATGTQISEPRGRPAPPRAAGSSQRVGTCNFFEFNLLQIFQAAAILKEMLQPLVANCKRRAILSLSES